MQFTVHRAKSQLSKLINAALQGEEVIIAKGNTPVVRLVPIPQGKFKMGVLANQVQTWPDFFEPMSEEELASWEDR